jgi:hypothetical protein
VLDKGWVGPSRSSWQVKALMQACGVPTHISTKVGIDVLKRRCIAWIEQTGSPFCLSPLRIRRSFSTGRP